MKPVKSPSQLHKLVVKGYKSIAECELELGRLNI